MTVEQKGCQYDNYRCDQPGQMVRFPEGDFGYYCVRHERVVLDRRSRRRELPSMENQRQVVPR